MEQHRISAAPFPATTQPWHDRRDPGANLPPNSRQPVALVSRRCRARVAGMARRVALARAIALDPQLIMYDEPFAGLDPISMGVTANLIRKLNDALGSTSVLVSHDVHESFAIADYVYFLSQGRIVAHGTPKQMIESDDPYVKQFVRAEADGPVPFHYPGRSLEQDLQLEGAQ